VKRWFKWLLWSLLVLGVVLGGAGAVLSTTQWGLQWVTARLTGALRGQLRIESVRGRLLGPIRIRGLSYQRPTGTVEVASVDFDWRPSALLAGTFHVDHLDLTGVRYSQTAPAPTAPAPPAQAPPAIPLPLAGRLKRLSVKDLTVQRAGAAPLHVDSVTLAARAGNGRIRVSRLAVTAPAYDVTVRGSLRPRGAYPMQWHAAYTVRPAGAKAFSGTLDLKGSLEALDLTQHLRTPVQVDVQGHVDHVLQQSAWRARVTLRDVKARDLWAGLPPAEVKGEIRLGGDRTSAAARGRLAVKTRLQGRDLTLDAGLALAYKDDALTVDRLTLDIPNTPTEVTVSGRVAGLTGARRAELKATWRHLAWPPAAKEPAQFASETGQLVLNGTPDDYSLTAHASVGAKPLPPATLVLKASGNRRAATLTDLRVKALDGTVTGRGSVAWRPRLAWRLQLQGAHLNPAAVTPDYPGQIDFAASVSGSKDEHGLAASLDLPRLQGRLHGYPVTGRTRMRLSGSQLQIQNLSLASGKTALSASGRIGKTWDLRWKINSPDVHALYPRAHGALHGHGLLQGRLRRPKVKADLSGRQLAYAAYGLRRIQASLDVDTSPGRKSTVAVKAFGVTAKGHGVDFIHLTAGGALTDHHLEVAVHTATGVLGLALAGGYRQGQWAGTLRQLDLTDRDLGYWHLDNPVPVTAGMNRLRVDRLCWERKDARLCGHGDWHRGGDWLADVKLDAFRLQWLAPFVTFQARLAGTVSADLAAQRKAGNLSGHGDITLKRASAQTTLPDGTPIALTITEAALKAKTRNRDIHATLRLSTDNGGAMDGDLTVPLAALPTMAPPGAPPARIRGQVKARLSNLKILPRLVPTIENTQGTLSGTVNVGGTLARPELSGSADWKDGQLDIPAIGIHVTKVSVSAKSPDARHFSLSGSAASGGGSMHVKASGELPDGAHRSMTVKITSQAFEVVRIPEAQALATSDVTLKLSATSVEFSGSVTIPQANLQPRDISSAVQPSGDVTMVNGPVEKKEPVRHISGRIRVILGRNVRIKGYGLKGQVTGNIIVQEQPKQPTLGFGSLDITGKYKAYGQNLDIRQGRLSYVGSPIDNPGLNVKAVRQTGDVTAGIHVTGTLQNPRLAVFSQPPMDDANALSYLLLGRPINQASTQQGSTLSNAATSLGLSGGEFLAKKIGRMFGIEDVKVESGNGGKTASLVLGKYLTPDLYISYGFGLLQPLNTVQLRYQISRHWELKAQSGLYNGGDILYTIDTH